MNRNNHNWQDGSADATRLRAAWAKGTDAAVIGLQMGVTRRAIMVAASRLGLPGRATDDHGRWPPAVIVPAVPAELAPVTAYWANLGATDERIEAGAHPLPAFHRLSWDVIQPSFHPLWEVAL